MHDYTREDILRLVEEEDVAFIRLQFTDIFGTMKNMAVTVSQLEKALDNRCMFDVSSVEGLSCDEDTDMYLYPDLGTFEIFPWRPQQGKAYDTVYILCLNDPHGWQYPSSVFSVLIIRLRNGFSAF